MLFGSQTRQAATLYIIGKLPRFLLRRHSAAFTARQGCFRLLNRYQDFESPPLALLPQNSASFTASSSPRSRPLSIACRTKAF